MKKKRFAALGVSLALFCGTLMSGFTYYDGMGNVYYDANMNIGPSTIYGEQIGTHPSNGTEHVYTATANFTAGVVKPYVFEGEVTGKYTLDGMVTWAEQEGYKVLAGINGDLFDTSSGAPRGISIHDGKIKSSGYEPNYALTFDSEGRAAATYTDVSYTMKGTIQDWVTAPAPTATDGGVAPGTEPSAQAVQSEISLPIGYFNVPHGGAKALHLFNRQYASSTKTKPNCVEVVLEPIAGSGPEPYINGTLKANVVSVTLNTSNTPIGDNQMVLSTVADSATAATIAKLVPGSTVEISVATSEGNSLATAKEAIGVYQLIAQNSQLTDSVSALRSADPRTCIGIKADGSVMIYAVDGRQSGVSKGLNLTDAAKHLIAQGCVTVVNMDGGGSTMFTARSPGKDTISKLRNSPSDKTQRKVTNGLLFVYAGKGSGVATQINLYPGLTVAMPGADVTVEPYASDELYEPVPLPGAVTYTVDQEDAVTGNGNTITMGKSAGVKTITAHSGSITGSTQVSVVEDVVFTPSITSLSIDPGASKDINVTASYGNVSAVSKDSLFTWNCDASIGTITQDGVFTAANVNGLTGNITVAYKDVVKTIPVQVGKALTFSDIAGHWAQSYIETLAGQGVINGMGNGLFAPESKVSRAQFLTMLAQSTPGAAPGSAPASGFADVSASEWYYQYVNWGFANGIVSGVDATHFSPNAQITREQMAVMLQNYLKLTNRTANLTANVPGFTDRGSISQWAAEAVNSVVAAGIMSGRPEGNFDPQGSATRAEAATVLYMTASKTAVSAQPEPQPQSEPKTNEDPNAGTGSEF